MSSDSGSADTADSPTPTDSSDPSFPWHRDADGDGYGDPTLVVEAATAPEGYVASDDDCDDSRADVHPGAEERCNSLDDDCSGEVDEESVDASIWYFDLDADGFGDPATTQTACDAPDSTWLLDGSDCDDSRADAFPGGLEVCGDGADNDCLGDGDMRCRPEGDISLADAELSLEGSYEDQRAGYSVAIGGDPQGTGNAAILVRSRGSGTPPDTGFVTLVNPATLGSMDVESAGINIYGDSSEAHWMSDNAMTVAGDINADGFDDLVLGNSLQEDVHTWFGPLIDGLSPADADIVVSDDTYTGIGWRAVSMGDADGNGLLELATSAMGSNYDPTWGWTRNGGHVVVMELSTDPVQPTSEALAVLRPHPVFEQVLLGRSLDSSDMDGDGVLDLAIGAPGYPGEFVYPCRENGTVYVIYGPLSGDMVLDDADCGLAGADAIWEGPDDLWYAGYSVSSRGDENGDGLADLLVGAPSPNWGSGWSFIVHGPTTGVHSLEDADWSVTSELDGDMVGFSVSMASDLDADGAADVVVNSAGPDEAGRFSLFYGGGLSGNADLTLSDANITGEDPSDYVCRVAGGGDVDGDGFDDLIIGTPYRSAVADFAGIGYIVFGGAEP